MPQPLPSLTSGSPYSTHGSEACHENLHIVDKDGAKFERPLTLIDSDDDLEGLESSAPSITLEEAWSPPVDRPIKRARSASSSASDTVHATDLTNNLVWEHAESVLRLIERLCAQERRIGVLEETVRDTKRKAEAMKEDLLRAQKKEGEAEERAAQAERGVELAEVKMEHWESDASGWIAENIPQLVAAYEKYRR